MMEKNKEQERKPAADKTPQRASLYLYNILLLSARDGGD